jgi:hypothetical protein
MKSRRRIAFPKAQTARLKLYDYSRDLRPMEWAAQISVAGQQF